MKLVRGAGLTGLGGVYPRRGMVIRPLLDVSRDELRHFLQSRGQSWREDESNVAGDNLRSRIRHRVLPELDRAYGGSTRDALARAAALAREDGEWLDEVSRTRFEALATRGQGWLELDAATLRSEPAPIVRRVLLRSLRELSDGREVGLEHVELAAAVLRGASGGVDLPGIRVEPRGEKLVLVQREVL